MNFLVFLSSFFLLLIISPIVIVGWYAITRGRIEYNPDGTPYRTGKIFKGWHFMWTQYKGVNMTLRGRKLTDLYVKMKDDGVAVDGFDCALESYLTFKELSDVDRCYIQSKYKIFLLPILANGDNYQVKVLHKVFIFPEWVRDPLSECPTCMASIYGSFIWWLIQFVTEFNMFAWAGIWYGWTSVIFWVGFCLGCAFLNTILAKKI